MIILIKENSWEVFLDLEWYSRVGPLRSSCRSLARRSQRSGKVALSHIRGQDTFRIAEPGQFQQVPTFIKANSLCLAYGQFNFDSRLYANHKKEEKSLFNVSEIRGQDLPTFIWLLWLHRQFNSSYQYYIILRA